jgi:exonuclease SbcD
VPKDLLSVFDVHVFGIFPGIENIEQIFVPLIDSSGKEVAVVAAIPFLQDRMVRQVGEGEGAKEIAEKIKQGMKTLFSEIGFALRKKYPNIPKIAMAHLHAQGTQISEAERDIQIGNQEGIISKDLDQFDYLALGHIHTGQTVIQGKVQYASSPISLGFTENSYIHKVLLLEIENNQIKESLIRIPKQRSLYQINGTMQEVSDEVKKLKNKYKLQVLLDLKIEEEQFNPKITDELDALREYLSKKVGGSMKIINTRIIYKDKPAARFSASFHAADLHDLKPDNVFKDLIATRDENEQTKLLALFSAIYADVNQS